MWEMGVQSSHSPRYTLRTTKGIACVRLLVQFGTSELTTAAEHRVEHNETAGRSTLYLESKNDQV
jgi:hypothetical protein